MKDCGCGKSKQADENYMKVKKLAQAYSDKTKEWIVLYFLDCGSWDFSKTDEFDERGKKNIEYIVPVY
ncbi:MAG: hypothetical protein FWF54_03635 [Candidatus Azobacteroides sp.]|nr:hypothetical protein [Candidatus Azobacteroides sp.]